MSIGRWTILIMVLVFAVVTLLGLIERKAFERGVKHGKAIASYEIIKQGVEREVMNWKGHWINGTELAKESK